MQQTFRADHFWHFRLKHSLRKALAYEVVLQENSAINATTVAQIQNTEPNFLVSVAGAFSLIGAVLGSRPHYLDYIFKAGATLLTLGAVIGQYLLLNFVKQEVPNLGTAVKSAPGTGSSIPFPPPPPPQIKSIPLSLSNIFCRSLLFFSRFV